MEGCNCVWYVLLYFLCIFSRNHVDFYFAYNGGIMTEIKDTFVACNSLDVHPENSAVVMKYERYPWDGTKVNLFIANRL